jgi:hypothetical protein
METERAVYLEYKMSGANASPPGRSRLEMLRVCVHGTRTCLIILVYFALLAAAPLIAHHGTGGIYNMEKSITLTGTVTIFKFVNPHVLVYFDVTDASTKDAVVNWVGEGPSVNNWTRTGWNRTSVKAGDRITVTLFPARSGKPEGVVHKIVTSNGKEWCCETK